MVLSLGDVETEYLFNPIKRLSGIYFTELLGSCLMGSNFSCLCGRVRAMIEAMRRSSDAFPVLVPVASFCDMFIINYTF